MSDSIRCPECGACLPFDAPEQLCPLCLMAGALEAQPEPPDLRSFEAPSDQSAPTSEAGLRFGPYTVLRVLGEGGMGMVYLARQDEPIQRQAALKVIKPGLDSRQVLARFEAERQALALMDHSGIARVFDAGAAADGRPYFAMEYVPGSPITEYCDSNRLGLRERLDLFRQACLAVHHAHQKGIIHRDIKPSNILVTAEDGRPVPKIIDFGIAKATSQRLTERTMYTEQGLLIGTPEYMSPEQAELGTHEVDTASDIYSLGIVLYELLAGSLPFDMDRLRSAGYLEVLRTVSEQDPPSLAERLRAQGAEARLIAEKRGTDPGLLERRLRGDLEWITMRAIEKDRARRYASASELAADIVRHLNDEPVLAGPPSHAYRLRKFVRKHRVWVAAATAILICLVAGLAAITAMYLAEQQQRDIAERNSYVANLANADSLIEGADYEAARERLFQCAPRLRGWEWRLLYALSDTSQQTLQGTGDHISLVPGAGVLSFTADAARVCFTMARTVHCWDARSWMPAGVFGNLGPIVGMAPDASRIAVRDPRPSASSVRIVETTSGKPLAELSRCGDTLAAAFSPDGTRAATISDVGALRVWDAGSGRLLLATPANGRKESQARVAFSRDGRRIAWSSGGLVRILETRTGRLIDSIQRPDTVLGLAFRPDGERLAIVDAANGIQIRNVSQPSGPHHGWTDSDACAAAAYSPDGGLLATAAMNGAVRVWDSDTGTILATLTGIGSHEAAAVSFSPDGELVLAGTRRGRIKVWDLRSQGGGSVIERRVGRMAVSTSGKRLAAASPDGLLVIDTATGRRLYRMSPATPATALSLLGGSLAYGDSRGDVRILDVRTGSSLRAWRAHLDPVRSLAFSPDGRHLASTSDDKTAKIWDVANGRETAAIFQTEAVNVVAFSPDGRLLATGAGEPMRPLPGGAVSLWEVPSGRLVRRLSPEWDWGEIVRALAFSPDGGRIVVGEYASGAVRVLETSTGKLLAGLGGHASEVTAVAFSPDGLLIASGSRDNTIRLWDAAGYRPLFALRRQGTPVAGLAFGAGGARLYAAHWDGSIRAWSTLTAYPSEPSELLSALLRRHRLWADVRHHLNNDPSMPGALRAEALRLSADRNDQSVAGNELLYRPLFQFVRPHADPALHLRRCEDFYRVLPSSLDAAAYLGGARYRMGLYQKAIEILEPVSAAVPDDPIAGAFLAMAYERIGRHDRAVESLRRAEGIALERLSVTLQREMAGLLQEARGVVRTTQLR